ncbi:MAG: hypothetical protein A2498_06100 [Lentisphaerae bacterium RIFOXYC12_FULL_60_16]|nr:MAG: hypothetical protein A2498_06100 [Lentisphaerae bacterium RIFOXYC12_FULL_60_16]
MVALVTMCNVAADVSATNAKLEEYQAAYEKQLKPICDEYLAALMDSLVRYEKMLDEAKTKMTQAGDLDGVLLIKGEIDRLQTERSVPKQATPGETPVIRDLRDQYRKQVLQAMDCRKQKTFALKQKYVQAMESLKVTLVKEEKLEDAIEVNEEIKRLHAETPDLAVASAPTAASAPAVGPTPTAAPAPPAVPVPARVTGIAQRAEPRVMGPATTFGIGQALIKENTTQMQEGVFVWKMKAAQVGDYTYWVGMQHAAPGKEGALRITAWGDVDGDGLPDKEIATSPAFQAKKADDWSEWQFSGRGFKNLFVGYQLKKEAKVFYSKRGWPADSSGMYPVLYLTREPGTAPTVEISPRATNLRIGIIK